VVAVSNAQARYKLDERSGEMVMVPHQGKEVTEWQKTAQRLAKEQSKHRGVIVENVHTILHVCPLKGK
jgi:hypothetical protein